MHPNAELITRFYTAFARGDGAAMAACYGPKISFSDPVFPALEGQRAGAMWQMLCEGATDLEIRFSAVQADDRTGSAHWEADYTFSTGRLVNNRIEASFTFEDGLIAAHVDRFDLYAWTRMALGPTGLFLGWTPMVQDKIRRQAAKGLDRWIAKQG